MESAQSDDLGESVECPIRRRTRLERYATGSDGAFVKNTAVEQFNDPLDPQRSLQLNNRYWKGESFQYLDVLREADDDAHHGRLKALRKSLKPVKKLLPARFHRSFIS